jgi:cbb3-type cytochrome oxidase subunit 3
MAEKSKGNAVKSSIGVLGALATIVSVWWFALRPRRKKGES